MRRSLLALPFLASLGLAQMPLVRQGLDERTVYWFLVNRAEEVLVVGMELSPTLWEALENKRVVLVVGEGQKVRARGKVEVKRLPGGPIRGGFLLANRRFFLASGKEGFVIVESPEVAGLLWGYFELALRSTGPSRQGNAKGR